MNKKLKTYRNFESYMIKDKNHKEKIYIKESSKNVDIDPFDEENWDDEDDYITKKMKNRILDFIENKGGANMLRNKETIINHFFPLLKTNIENERTYEIRGNFGSHIFDDGDRLGVVKARNAAEAKVIFTLVNNRRDYMDVLLTGFYRSIFIRQQVLNRSLEENRKKLRIIQDLVNNLENPKGINDI